MREISDLMELLKGEDARDIYAVAEVFAEIQIIELLKAKGGEYEFEEDELKPYLALNVDGIEEVSVEKVSLDENDNIIVFVKHTYPSDDDSVYSYNIYDFSTGQIILLIDFLC
jgi:hypothetical protein